MARPLRIQYENAYYHVTCRGNARQRIYASEADRSVFLDLLGRSALIYQTEVLAYVLMRNHFHLLVKTLGLHFTSISRILRTRAEMPRK